MPALAFAADGALFGVAGTRDDLARLFRYTEAQGVQDLGLTVPVATCLVVMPDGGILVAGADRINDLALYRF
jgi:cyanophycinase-like exopeptidase